MEELSLEKLTINEKPPKLDLIDLFSGTGAFSYAFHQTGRARTVFANDICPNSKKIFDLNFKRKLTLGDIHGVEEIPEFDLLSAGFACQPFSIAGEQKGFNDPRSNVFWKLLEIIEAGNPKAFILENVKNLQSHDSGKTFEIIKDSLENLGYHLKYQILNTCEVTEIPQHRERIYILGFRDRKKYKMFNFDFPETQMLNLSEIIGKTEVDKKYYYSDRFKDYTKIEAEITKTIEENVLYQYRRYYVRENKSNVSPCLTANMGSGGHNVPLLRDSKGIRKLTPRECFSLQGFPESYKLPSIADSGLYKLAGNAVSLPVVQLIADRLVSIL